MLRLQVAHSGDMTSATLIPDRRRKYFPRNGGPRPGDNHRRCAHEGIAAAREVLEATTPTTPKEPAVIKRLSPAQIERARRGIAAARRALKSSTGPTQEEGPNDERQ